VLCMVVKTNPVGRTGGPIWLVLGFMFYYFYRRHRKLPILSSVPRDWTQDQIDVYLESGETGLAEEYQEALRRRQRRPKPEPRVERRNWRGRLSARGRGPGRGNGGPPS
jgi:hypothetical protein